MNEMIEQGNVQYSPF